MNEPLKQQHFGFKFGISPHYLSKEVGFKVGSVFEQVKEVLIPQSGNREGRYLKTLVEVDLTQPLMRYNNKDQLC